MPDSISEIRPLGSDPNLRRVRVGNKTVATLRAIDIDALQLSVGDSWTQRLQQAVARTTAINRSRRDAMKLLGRRPLSRREVIDKLSSKGHDRSIVEQLADELQTEGWIDDAGLAMALRDELVKRKSAGPRLIQAKLKSRQIEPDLADQLSRDAATSDSNLQTALTLAKRRLKSMANQPRPVAQRRIAATLARKGFDDDVIEQVLDKLNLHDQTPNDW